MCTACIVPVKRLRRTENVRGTFEGEGVPRMALRVSYPMTPQSEDLYGT